MKSIYEDGGTASIRRLAHHVQHGGTLSQRDIDHCVRVCEDKDFIIERLTNRVKFLEKALFNLSSNIAN